MMRWLSGEETAMPSTVNFEVWVGDPGRAGGVARKTEAGRSGGHITVVLCKRG